MLSVTFKPFMLIVVMLSVTFKAFMLIVVMLSVVMTSKFSLERNELAYRVNAITTLLKFFMLLVTQK